MFWDSGGGWKSSPGDNLFIPDCKALIWLVKGCQRREGPKLHIEVERKWEWDMGSSISRLASNKRPVNILGSLCFKESHSGMIATYKKKITFHCSVSRYELWIWEHSQWRKLLLNIFASSVYTRSNCLYDKDITLIPMLLNYTLLALFFISYNNLLAQLGQLIIGPCLEKLHPANCGNKLLQAFSFSL